MNSIFLFAMTLFLSTSVFANTQPWHPPSVLTVDVGLAVPQRMDQLPRTYYFSLLNPVSAGAKSQGSSIFRIEYGDGASDIFSFSDLRCDYKGSDCVEEFSATNHAYSVAGEYTSTIYKDNVAVWTKTVLVYAADLKISTKGGADVSLNRLTGKAPLSVTFSFRGGTSIDYGDGTSETFYKGSRWSHDMHQLTHTYTSTGYHQVIIKYKNEIMEGAEISVSKGLWQSIGNIMRGI